MTVDSRHPAGGPLSLRAYARRRGVSVEAVRKAIKSGRLRGSLQVKNGSTKIVDAELADREWAGNTDLTRAHDDVKLAAAAREAATAGPSNSVTSTPAVVAQPQGGKAVRPDTIGVRFKDDWDVQGSDGTPAKALADASARQKHWQAELAALKYRKAAGELVDAEQLRLQLADVFTTCRSRLLGLANRAKSRLPHLTLEDVNAIDGIVREALEELAEPELNGAPSASSYLEPQAHGGALLRDEAAES